MARVFKRKDRLSAMSEINITSLLDLVFCLLIIFMITTPLMEQTIPVNLPEQARNPSADRNAKLKYVAVTFTEAGQYSYDKDPVTLDQLRAKFKELAAQSDPPVVSIRGDQKALYDAGAKVFAAMQEAGLTKMSLDTQVK
jgi:biopolymer transport protein ExbD